MHENHEKVTQPGGGVGGLPEESRRQAGVDGGEALVLDHAHQDRERRGSGSSGLDLHDL